MTYFLSPASSYISTGNSSTTNLAAGNSYTFTGTAEQTNHPDVMVTLKADQATTISLQFSHDGTNWDSQIPKFGVAGTNEFTTAVKGHRYFRVVVTTASLTTTYFRLQTQFGLFRQGNLSLNSAAALDSDAMVVRPSLYELEVARSLRTGISQVNKFGRNGDIDAAQTEDIWASGGTWSPPTAAGTVAIVSDSVNDTSAGTGARTILVSGLDGDYLEVEETVTLNGTTPVNTANSYFIVHRMIIATAGSGGTAAGTITSVSNGTGTPTFPSIQLGSNQTQFCIFQVPAGKTMYMFSFRGAISGGTTAEIDLFAKPFGGVYNLKGEVRLSSTGSSHEEVTYKIPLKFTEKTIVKLTCSAASNNTVALGSFDAILVTNT
jgi:hypothetical protein